MSDSTLSVEALLGGSHTKAPAGEMTESFEQLYEHALPRIYAFVRWQVGNASVAEDIVGQIFLKAYGGRNRAPLGPSAISWLFRIAHNVLIDYRRVEGRRERLNVSLDEIGGGPASVTLDPEAALSAKERKAMLLAAVGDLEERDKTLLALKFAARQTNREIAAILDISEGAVAMRLLRSLRRLRVRLQALGLT
jgi:RNA polymerase sigma factor (sigma-70 family)